MEIMMSAAPPSTTDATMTARRTTGAPPRPSRPRSSELRHPWAGVQHPATGPDEERFVDQLRAIAACDEPAGPDDVTRTEITALVNALRAGLDAIDLLRRAPGLVPGRLVAAYELVDRQRAASADAWAAIVDDPVPAVVLEHAPLAARLLPVVVVELVAAARRDDPQLARRVATAQREVERIEAIARRLEAWMTDPTPHAMDPADVGRLLFDLEEPGLWAHSFYLPTRVGSLVPVRLAALLGEQVAAVAA